MEKYKLIKPVTINNKKVKELARQFLKEENNNEETEERTND